MKHHYLEENVITQADEDLTDKDKADISLIISITEATEEMFDKALTEADLLVDRLKASDLILMLGFRLSLKEGGQHYITPKINIVAVGKGDELSI